MAETAQTVPTAGDRAQLVYDTPREESLLERTQRFLAGKVIWIFVLIFFFWTLGPLYWTLSASFMHPNEVYHFNPFPQNPTLGGYERVLFVHNFPTFFLNSLFLSIWTTVSTVIVSSLAAYAFARYLFPFRHLLLLLVLVPRLVPRISLIVPLYMMLDQFGMLNTRAALMLLYTASSVPLSTWILVGFFKGVPKELEESAAIDGASVLQRLYRIVLPIALPGLITVAVFAFRDAWNEFPFVLAFTSSANQRTLPYALFLLDDSIGLQDWPAINAFAILTIVPVLLIYLRFEKQVVSGITKGALK